MYTSAVADVCKTIYFSLRLLPLSEGQKVHHLFYVSGVVVFDGQDQPAQKLESSQKSSSDVFLVGPLNPLNTAPNSLLIDVSEVNSLVTSDVDFLNKFENIFVSSGKSLDSKQIEALNIFESVKSKFSLLILESHNLNPENLFQLMPDWLKPKVIFVYLPKQSPRDCILSPVEVVERLKVRALQSSEQSLDLNIASFGAGGLADSKLINFYNFPCEAAYLKIIEKEKYFRFLLLKILSASGLAGVLGFLCWILKVALNPSDYKIGLELQGWGYRSLGWLHGLIVDSVMLVRRIYGLAVMVAVKSFWFIKRNLGRSWEIRLFIQGLWGSWWKAKVLVQRQIGEMWRIKLFILSLPGQSWKIRVYALRLLGESWRVRVLFQNLYWKARALAMRLLEESWRIRIFFVRCYWWMSRVPVSYLLFPFRKVYWFSKYQFETRVLRRKEESLDSD